MGERKDKIMTLKNEIDKWFRENYSYLQGEVKNNIAIDQMSQYADDLLSICTESFLTRTPEQQQQMLDDDKIANYILYCCGFQIKSAQSPLYNQFRREKMRARSGMLEFENNPYVPDEQLEDTELYQCYLKARSELHWYHQRLLEMKWDEGLTYQEIRNRTNITLNSIQKDMAIIYQIIRQKCNHCT